MLLSHEFKNGGLSKAAVEKFKIPLPPLDDQKRIAHLLGKVEGLIARRKGHLQQLVDLPKSVFLEMFGDKKRFNTKTIEEIASKEKYSLSSGPFGSNLTSKHYVSDGVIVLRGKNISSGKLDLSDIKYISEKKALELQRSEIRPGDVVIVAVGSSGSALVIPNILKRAIMSQNFNKVSPNIDIVLPVYLEFSINSEFVQRQFRRVLTDAGRTFLALSKIKEVKIKVPPLNLQNQFAEIIEKVEGIKFRYHQSLADLENLYGSLSQKAFKGELDLSRVPLPSITADLAVELPSIEVEMHGTVEEVFYELPDPDDLKILESSEGRRALLEQWLDAYLKQLGDKPFSAQQFMDIAFQKLEELFEHDAPLWGVNEYDQIKEWVFQGLKSGRLKQNYCEEKNLVQITSVKS